MLFRLVRLQAQKRLASMTTNKRNKKSGGKGAITLIIVVFIFVFIGAASIVASIADIAYTSYHPLGLDWYYFLFFAVFSLMVSFLFTVFTAYSQLFASKDNELLLSMPISPRTILASRVISMWTLHIIIIATVMLPAEIVFCIKGGAQLMQVLCCAVLIIMLSFLSLTLAILIGWVIGLITKNMRHKNIIATVFGILLMLVYFLIVSGNKWNEIFVGIITGAQAFADKAEKVYPVYAVGAAALDDLASLLIVSLICLGLLAVTVLVVGRSFVGIATAKTSSKKIGYKAKDVKTRSLSSTLLRKEMARFFSSPTYIMNTTMGLLISIVVIIMVGLKMSDPANGAIDPRIKTVVGIVLLSVISAFDYVSAPSVSLESKTLWILRSLPITSADVLFAKTKLHIVICTPFVAVSSIIAIVMLKPDVWSAILMVLLPIAYVVFGAAVGIMQGTKHANFNWVTETQAIKSGVGVLFTMLIMFATTLVSLGVTLACAFVFTLPLQACFSVLLLFVMLLDVFMMRRIKTTGVKFFEAL